MAAHIVIIYFSATGNTRKLAKAINIGAQSVGEIRTTIYSISGDEIIKGRFISESLLQLVDDADAVIFGSPTYMGGAAAQFKAFADSTGERWSQGVWSGKIAAGFTSGSCPSGDQMDTLQYFNLFASQHGMIWCGVDIPTGFDMLKRNPLGAFLGVAAHDDGNGLADIYLETAKYLGARVASLAKVLGQQKEFN